MNPARARTLLRNFDFCALFVEELGWDRYSNSLEIALAGSTMILSAIAEKRGMVAYHCHAPDGQALPDYARRRKIEQQVAKAAHEHLIVFTDPTDSTQIWQWVKREPGQLSACREHPYHPSQPGDALLQKLESIAFSLDEEETLSLTEVTRRVRGGFDVERVTKRFYELFRKEHTAFLGFIAGIADAADREWYASVMLNRLMFVWFIQHKGFLDGDRDYLRNRLVRTQAEHGKDKFWSFYRYFLLRLFHEGLGSPGRSSELEKLLGRIPWLNGGLFDIHELESPDRYGSTIEIPDAAFERIFDYFDRYQWHLDNRPLKADNEINPDVLGYIFEKYVNQKQMGAYYTKEDITDYIAKNAILPFLFDAARSKCRIAFENPNGPAVWNLLGDDPDRYIYSAVRHGTGQPLPPDIAVGLDPPTLHQRVGPGPVTTLELRKSWNRPAPPEFALPTETWREVVARRKRYDEVRAKLIAGEVRDINDLITLNLDIRQFAQDLIENCEGPELLRAFWHAIQNVTVLDPTCGSGAFLFAALNILEPLYEACLTRMEAFLGDLDRSGEKHRPEKFADFRKVLENVAAHPNRRFFILKSIILRNLYGVDIMKEAVEICKLRLFLTLAAQVTPDVAAINLGIEPLPDIDFNIRAGNTLVGYVSYDEVMNAITSKLDLDNAMEKIATRAADLQQASDAFRRRQIEGDGSVPTEHKLELRRRLKALGGELDRHLAIEYGVEPADQATYASWAKSHQPFHWFIEFHGIMSHDGFDVTLGNPPYVEYSRSAVGYKVKALETAECDNLWAFVLERSTLFLRPQGRMSLITPLSLISTERFAPARKLLTFGATYTSFLSLSGDAHPSILFVGVKMSYTIFTYAKAPIRSTDARLYTSKLYRWLADERDLLFSLVQYHAAVPATSTTIPYKVGSALAAEAIAKINRDRTSVAHFTKRTGYPLLYHRIVRHFVKVLSTPPYFWNERDGEKKSEDYKLLLFEDEVTAKVIRSFLVSSTCYLVFVALSDAYHCGRDLLLSFPVGAERLSASETTSLVGLGDRYERDLFKNSARRRIKYRATGWIEYDEFYPRESKCIADEIDSVLAEHYAFAEEELDFIVNYDIKYRLGSGPEPEDDE